MDTQKRRASRSARRTRGVAGTLLEFGMSQRSLATVLVLLFALGVCVACGGGDPEGEATWETHTTSPDESSGGEEEAE